MSAWQQLRQVLNKGQAGLRKAGQAYGDMAEKVARPAMRLYDAQLMTPDQRAGLVYSERIGGTQQTKKGGVPKAGGQSGGTLEPTDQNLLGRLMISDPSDTAATALLSDPMFAQAVGSTPEALLKQRQVTLDAISRADRLQAATAPNPDLLFGGDVQVPALNEQQRISTLLANARASGSNEDVVRVLEELADPHVMRPSNPVAWDAAADIAPTMDGDYEARMMSPKYLDPWTNEYRTRGAMPQPPGDPRIKQERLSSFLSRAYGAPSDTAELGNLQQRAAQTSGGFNADISQVVDMSSDSSGARAYQELNSLRDAAQGVESIGFDAAERLGYVDQAELLRKAEGLKGRSKIHTAEGGLQPIALERLSDRELQLGRQLTTQERKKVLNELNDELPDVAYSLGLGSSEAKQRKLYPHRYAADILSAADRAGYQAVNVPNSSGSDKRQPKYAYVTDDARAANRIITDPKTGMIVGGLALAGTVASIQAAINNQRKDQLKFNHDITGHDAFDSTVPQEVRHVLKNIDPAVLSQMMSQ